MTETDSMVVRVVKAICAQLREQGSSNYVDAWEEDCVTLDGDFQLTPIARAVIEAMLEPTPAVLEEGYDKLDFYDEQSDAADKYNREVVQSVWSAMIRKALEE